MTVLLFNHRITDNKYLKCFHHCEIILRHLLQTSTSVQQTPMTAILMHFALIPMDRLIAPVILDTLVTERHVLVSIS